MRMYPKSCETPQGMLFVCTCGSSSHHIALKPIINRAGLLIHLSGFGFNQSLHSSGFWMISYTVNIVLEDLTKLFPGGWENQEFNSWQQCTDVRKNQIHSIYKKIPQVSARSHAVQGWFGLHSCDSSSREKQKGGSRNMLERDELRLWLNT